ATYSDGSTAPVDPAVCTITGYSAKPAGDKMITVEYEGQTVQFKVKVEYVWWQWLIRILLLGFIWY
ncbi:MAG: bacterial Ig-like domain-containing protein, partial [Clostridiales bacterium]|nr:bacterial Ig-like domain-containing protein [Clostridiales bacterium]